MCWFDTDTLLIIPKLEKNLQIKDSFQSDVLLLYRYSVDYTEVRKNLQIKDSF